MDRKERRNTIIRTPHITTNAVIDIDRTLARDGYVAVKQATYVALLRAAKQAYTDLEPYEFTDLPVSGYAVMDTVRKLRAAIAAVEGRKTE